MIYDPNMARWPAMVTGHTNDRRPVDIAYAARAMYLQFGVRPWRTDRRSCE